MEGVVARERRIPMNMRLLILSLIALLGLGSMEAAEVNAGSSGDLSLGQEKQLLDQQHQALEQEELTLAQTYRQLLDQKRALLEQLRALNPKGGTTKDWNDLWENYHQYKVAKDEDDDEEDYKDKYNDKLKALGSKDVDKDGFKSKVEALLKALEAVRKQQDSLTQSFVTHHSKIQQLDQDKKGHNQRTGRQ